MVNQFIAVMFVFLQRPSSIVSDSSVEPVPSSAASSPSNSSLCYDMMGPAGGFINNNYLVRRKRISVDGVLSI